MWAENGAERAQNSVHGVVGALQILVMNDDYDDDDDDNAIFRVHPVQLMIALNSYRREMLALCNCSHFTVDVDVQL